MTDLPVASRFTDGALNNGQAKAAQNAMLSAMREMPGGEAVTTLTIASGVIVPTRAVHLVDTESSAASDDLDRISNVNHPDGRILILGTVDASRDVTVKHGLTTSGANLRILLAGGADLVLSDPSMRLVLQRRGTDWVEILRDYGTETSAARARLRVGGPWVDVASAATVNLGAAPSTNVRITGTTTITGFGATAANGERVMLRFAGALTLTHNAASLILPGGANITTAAGDTAEAVSLGAGAWVVTEYQRANGQAVLATGGLQQRIVYVASGTFTVPAGVNRVFVEVQAGGGGGGSGANTSGNAGSTGGTSSFGTALSSAGGVGGTYGNGSGGSGGLATVGAGAGGALSVPGQEGQGSQNMSSASSPGRPSGGSSVLGRGGQLNGSDGTGFGGGGAGGNSTGGWGSGGGAGAYISGWVDVTPGASIAVTVGAGGAKGTSSGPSGQAGGLGAQGLVALSY